MTYEPPRIEALSVGRVNRSAYGMRAAHCDEIDGVCVERLLGEHGSPLFVLSERTLRQTYRQAKAALARHFSDFQFAWSYKTNYLRAVCSVFHQEGALAEVVSEFEYEKARELGVPGERIIFNGPHKPAPILRRALREGARIQIDNWDELAAIEEIVAADGLAECAVSLRVSLDAGVRPVWTKFGFNLESGEAWRAARRLKHGGLVRLSGLHAHIGTFILDANAYAVAAGKLMELRRRIREELDFKIEVLNLGGGFASHNALHGQYRPAEEVVPSFDDYAEAIHRGICDGLKPGEKPPKLLLETGRALVDEAGYLLTTVVAGKRLQRFGDAPAGGAKSAAKQRPVVPGSPALIVDAGVHLLYTAQWYRHKITSVRAQCGRLVPTTIFGCLCMNIDVIQEACALPALSPGDALAIHPVGAYNITQSMQFIGYRPAVVMVMADGLVEVIRERERLKDVESLEHLPAGWRERQE